MPERTPKSHSNGTAITVSACCVLCCLVGCQSYQPKPLAPDEHLAAWLARKPDSEPVRRFSEQLAETADVGVTFDPADGLTVDEGE